MWKRWCPWVKMVYFIFQTEYGQFPNCIIKQKYSWNEKNCSRSMSGTGLSVWGWNLRANKDIFHNWVRFLTRSFYSIFTQMISAIFVRSWRVLACKLGIRQELASFWKIIFTLLHRRAKGKTWLIINHEFVKEAKTTAARFEKLNSKFRV